MTCHPSPPVSGFTAETAQVSRLELWAVVSSYVRAAPVQLNARNTSGSKCGPNGWSEAVLVMLPLKDPQPTVSAVLLLCLGPRWL